MKNDAEVHIAGWKTPEDWGRFRGILANNSDSETWSRAYSEFFLERLALRYLNPIKILQKHGTFQGEGFSILALQCTLIEFLESTVQGVIYRFIRPGERLGPHEYSSSTDVFVSFLCKRPPFARHFNEKVARDFYRNVRCGLLHEARTKGEWKVWAEDPGGAIVDAHRYIIYRNNFQRGLDEFIRWYGKALPTDTALQEAFVRKFDYLADQGVA